MLQHEETIILSEILPAELDRFELLVGTEAYINQQSEDLETIIPRQYSLAQNYPNPFNPSTTIAIQIPTNQMVSIKIYDIMGQVVKTIIDNYIAAGAYKFIWDGRNNAGRTTASGIYFCRLYSGTYVKTIKLVKMQ